MQKIKNVGQTMPSQTFKNWWKHTGIGGDWHKNNHVDNEAVSNEGNIPNFSLSLLPPRLNFHDVTLRNLNPGCMWGGAERWDNLLYGSGQNQCRLMWGGIVDEDDLPSSTGMNEKQKVVSWIEFLIEQKKGDNGPLVTVLRKLKRQLSAERSERMSQTR